MLSKEMSQRIGELKSDEEINSFIVERIKTLESGAEAIAIEAEPGLIFDDFIGNKVKYSSLNGYYSIPSIVYDDFTPYVNMIKLIRDSFPRYGFIGVLHGVFRGVYDYMGTQATDEKEKLRKAIYFYTQKQGIDFVSVKDFSDNKCGFCSENAGLSHNMFKVLGIDSQLIGGFKIYQGIREKHAFNLVYPQGYSIHKRLLFDPSHFINFQDQNEVKKSFPYFIKVSEEEYDYMRAGVTTHLDIESTIDLIEGSFGPFGKGDYDEGCYTIGIADSVASQEILDSMHSTSNQASKNKRLRKEQQ